MSRARRLALAAVLTLALGATARADDFKSGVLDPPHPAPEFSLKGSDGVPISLARFKGKVVVVYFGFTYCPKVCPTTLAKVTRAFKDLGPQASDVQFVFISVDPDRDSPERMKEYLAFFNPTFLGATGTGDELSKVQKEYGVVAKRAASENPKLGYEMHHSSSLHLVDRSGKLRVLVPYGSAPEDVVHDLKLLLAK